MLTAEQSRVDLVADVVKNKLNIVDLLESRGVFVENGGGRDLRSCPFHSDSSPSMHVNEEEQIFKCFSCGRGGTFVHLLNEFIKEDGVKKEFTYFDTIEFILKNYKEVREEVDYDTVFIYKTSKKVFDMSNVKMMKPNKIQLNYKITQKGADNITEHLDRMYLIQKNGMVM